MLCSVLTQRDSSCWIDEAATSFNSTKIYSDTASYPFHDTTVRTRFVSDYVRLSMGKKFYKTLYEKREYDKEAWEAACIIALTRGGNFKVRYLPKSTQHLHDKTARNAPKVLSLSRCNNNSADIPDWENLDIEKTNFHQDGYNFFMYRDFLFSAYTIGSKGSLPIQGLIKLLRKMKANQTGPLRIYHCVPKFHYYSSECMYLAPGFEGPPDMPLQQFVLLLPPSLPPLNEANDSDSDNDDGLDYIKLEE